MMKTLHTILVGLCLLAFADLSAQTVSYDIRFAIESVDCDTRTVCVLTQLRSADGEAWNLAGQNYRLFYDGSKADYITGSGESMLSAAQYSGFPDDPQDVNSADATMFGDALPFAATLSFLNYSIDLMNLTNGGVNLPASGEWVTTTKLCFEVTQEVLDEASDCLSIVWARIGLTDQYATASVEVSQWVEANVTTEAVANIYDDLGPEDGNDACLSSFCAGGADAETSAAACEDGIDNDIDGLIDCDDPDCANTAPCPANNKTFDLALQLAPNGVDCATGSVCYDVNLTSAGSEFNLGSQNYRIFYNSSAGSFLSAQSLLGTDFQAVSLQSGTPREGVDATGTGTLPYESTLGFVDFTVQLNDSGTGSAIEIVADQPTRVAQVCFTMSAAVINEATECFEANWAEFGLTDAYETAFVEIEEWLGPNNTRITSVNNFGNLNPSSGDDSCFDMSCSNTETGETQCGDGIDNDNDGLIDCQDPGCASTVVCMAECNASAPTLAGNTTMTAQSCDYLTGPVALTSTGGNITDTYTTQYVLTSLDGTIRDIQDEPSFEILQEGMYTVYAVNYRNDLVPADLANGNNIDIVTSTCFELSEAYTFTVCEELDQCTECLGQTVSIGEAGNPATGFTRTYVLTDSRGDILLISESPDFPDLGEGLYSGVVIDYETAIGINGLEVGTNVAALECNCAMISDAFIFGVCDQLMPDILFDLNGCDITTQALLLVAEEYDSYLWSTGSTSPEISVSATTPAVYRVTVTLANGCEGVAEQVISGEEFSKLGDFVFEDMDADGRQEATDPGINGVTVNLYADFDRNGIPDLGNIPSCTTTTGNHPDTGEPGYYEFFVYQSNYVIEFVAPGGFSATTANTGDDAGDSDINASGFTNSIVVAPNVVIDNIDAGFRTSTSIGGSVWEDLDADGRRDAEESGLNGVTINLFTADGELIASILTDSIPGSELTGGYCFENVPVQDYYVEIVLPDGAVLSDPNVSSNDALDSEGTGANGPNTTDVIMTSAGVKTDGVDFGTYFGGQLCGLVWRDAPMGQEGIYEPEVDTVVMNSRVFLIDEETRDTTSVAATRTDGTYCFESVPVGSYRVGFGAAEAATSYATQNVGRDPLVDSDVNTTTLQTEVIFVGSQDTILGINAGLRMGVVPVTLSSFSGYWDRGKNVNVIDWSTASEIGNERFDVERLIGFDGTFEVIGSVEGQGNSSVTAKYQFLDGDTDQNGTYYYRLKQVDYNGGEERSDIIAINISNLKSIGRSVNTVHQDFLKVFPNPAAERVQVMLASDQDNSIDISLTDLTGRQILSWNNVPLEKGKNLISLKLDNVTSGSYMLQFFDGERIGHQLLQIAK